MSDNNITENRPWGSFTVLGAGESFKVKTITIAPGGELSLQYHNHRSEYWTITSGSGFVTVGECEFAAHAPDFFAIKRGEIHSARSDMGMTFVEVQYGDRLEEEDIVRLKDKYNRASDE